MQLAIIILSYCWFVNDLIVGAKKKPNNLILSGALITLVSWQENLAWGISILCFASLMLLIQVARKK